jgi:hypothetical protein
MSVRGKRCAIFSPKYSELFFDAGITQCADDFGTAVDDVASFQELTSGCTDTIGCARKNDVARFERTNTREIRDQERDIENEVGCTSLLHALTRDITPDTDVIGIAE